MLNCIAICPHSSGGIATREIEVSGETIEEVLEKAWNRISGSRYVSAIYLVQGGQRQLIYQPEQGRSE